MSKLFSNFKPLVTVNLPPPKGRQIYMHTFSLEDPHMPEGYEDYLEPVMALLKATGANKGKAHLTVDEKVVKVGMSQRKPKPHVDGCFVTKAEMQKAINAAVSISGGAYSSSGGWGHVGGGGVWLHYCNNIPTGEFSRMPVIVAASQPGCKAWKGIFEGTPTEAGDLSHISDQLGEGEVLPANVGYILSPDCVHESMLFDKDTPRTFIRIALPNSVDYGFN